jgi:hypothetical protein
VDVDNAFVASYIVLWAIVAAEGLLLLGTIRVIASLPGTRHGSVVAGQPVADALLAAGDGKTFSLRKLAAHRNLAVVVASATCSSCPPLLRRLSESEGQIAEAGWQIIVIRRDPNFSSRLFDDALPDSAEVYHLEQQDSAYERLPTPALFTASDGIVTSVLSPTDDIVRTLVGTARVEAAVARA